MCTRNWYMVLCSMRAKMLSMDPTVNPANNAYVYSHLSVHECSNGIKGRIEFGNNDSCGPCMAFASVACVLALSDISDAINAPEGDRTRK